MAVEGRLRARRSRIGCALVAAAAALTGCAGPAGTTTTASAAPSTIGGVTVTVRAESHDGHVQVLAELRPEQPGFHLYSLTLPNGGIDGIGIPTRIRAEGGLRATGPATTDAKQRVLRPAGLDVSLPVYEDGRVTLELPVRRREDTDSARVFLTYGACSETAGCLPPVRDHEVTLRLGSAG